MLCPCWSNLPFDQCCEPYLLGKEYPAKPETLMRSRYTAYALKNYDYIEQTMRGKALKSFNKKATQSSEQPVVWEKLEVISAPEVSPAAEEGYVEFIAYYLLNGELHSLYERSRFVKRKERWYYIDGKMLS